MGKSRDRGQAQIASHRFRSLKQMDVLRQAHAANPKKVWWAARASVNSEPSLEGNLANYNEEGYGNMTLDFPRNTRYRAAILAHVKKNKLKWLEVGPGKDAVLTKMVMEAGDDEDKDTMILSIEGNDKAVPEARKKLKQYKTRAKLISALSTDQESIDAIHAYGTVQGIVQEVLGFFASSEGVAYIVAELKKEAAMASTAVYVPTRAATFCCPIYFTQARLGVQNEVYVAENVFALVRKLGIIECRADTNGTWSPKAGMVEYLDFQSADAAELAKKHRRQVRFTTSTVARVNGIGCWIWAETLAEGGEKRLARTQYPYGAAGAPAVAASRLDFSSLWDDDAARGLGWRNVILPFEKTIQIRAQESLIVEFGADLRTPTPKYNIQVWKDDGDIEVQEYGVKITNINPVFEADK